MAYRGCRFDGVGCLREQGLVTGFYTSPHLIDIRERFRINGKRNQLFHDVCGLSDLTAATEPYVGKQSPHVRRAVYA